MSTLKIGIDPEFESKILEEVKDEDVALSIGTELFPGGYVAGKINSGARGHVYSGYMSLDEKKSMEPILNLVLPWEVRKHYLGLLKRTIQSKTASAEDINKYGKRVGEVLTPMVDQLQREIRHKNPAHNNRELEELVKDQTIRKIAFKFVSKDKLKDPDTAKEFETEYSLLAKLRHSSFPQMIRLATLPQGTGYATTFVDGKTLDELTAEGEFWQGEGKTRRDYLPVPVVLAVMHQFYRALSHAHKKGVLVQDIQPGNIMIDFDGNVNLIDLGFAEPITPNKKSLELAGGDDLYLPPEIVKQLEPVEGKGQGSYGKKIRPGSELPFSLKSCVFPTGIIAYQLIADMDPHGNVVGDKFSRIQQNILNVKPTSPAAHNKEYSRAEIDALVMAPLQKDPEKRPSVQEQEQRIQELLEQRKQPPSEIILEEFMRPLKELRQKAYLKPDAELARVPEKARRRSGSTPIRKSA